MTKRAPIFADHRVTHWTQAEQPIVKGHIIAACGARVREQQCNSLPTCKACALKMVQHYLE